jgi:hypothetical protein
MRLRVVALGRRLGASSSCVGMRLVDVLEVRASTVCLDRVVVVVAVVAVVPTFRSAVVVFRSALVRLSGFRLVLASVSSCRGRLGSSGRCRSSSSSSSVDFERFVCSGRLDGCSSFFLLWTLLVPAWAFSAASVELGGALACADLLFEKPLSASSLSFRSVPPRRDRRAAPSSPWKACRRLLSSLTGSRP